VLQCSVILLFSLQIQHVVHWDSRLVPTLDHYSHHILFTNLFNIIPSFFTRSSVAPYGQKRSRSPFCSLRLRIWIITIKQAVGNINLVGAVFTHTHTHTHRGAHARTHTHTRAREHAYAQAHIHTRMHAHSDTNTHAYAYTYAHAHRHAQLQTERLNILNTPKSVGLDLTISSVLACLSQHPVILFHFVTVMVPFFWRSLNILIQ